MKKIISVFMILFIVASFSLPASAVSASYSSTKSFIYILDDNNIKYTVNGIVEDDYECVSVNNSGDYFNYTIKYFFDSNLENASLRVWDIITFNDSDFYNVLKVVNDFNASHKYGRLYVDESDNTVTAASDLIFRTHDVDEICLEATLYIVQTIDEAYKDLRVYNVA